MRSDIIRQCAAPYCKKRTIQICKPPADTQYLIYTTDGESGGNDTKCLLYCMLSPAVVVAASVGGIYMTA